MTGWTCADIHTWEVSELLWTVPETVQKEQLLVNIKRINTGFSAYALLQFIFQMLEKAASTCFSLFLIPMGWQCTSCFAVDIFLTSFFAV